MSLTRNERLKFNLRLNKNQVEQHREAIHTVLTESGTLFTDDGLPMYDDDELKIDYSIWISYFGTVENCLKAIASILRDPSVVTDASLEETIFGESVFVSVLDALRDCQQAIAERQPLSGQSPTDLAT